jgi:DeoR/GlpR family transcriptional regulator of sugar metabolism
VATTHERGFCSIAELGRLLRVSDMTIRRDVAELTADGKLRQVFGGVTRFDDQGPTGTDYSLRLAANQLAKSAIGRRAAEVVTSGSVVALDTGSTALAVAAHLGDPGTVTVLTSSWPILSRLKGRPGIELVALGGSFHEDLQAFNGPLTLMQIDQLRVDVFFLGASGVTERGIYCANQHDAVTKRALIEVASRVVLVADSAKFGSGDGMLRVANLADVDLVVVDAAIPAHARDYLSEAGTALVEVTVDPASQGG